MWHNNIIMTLYNWLALNHCVQIRRTNKFKIRRTNKFNLAHLGSRQCPSVKAIKGLPRKLHSCYTPQIYIDLQASFRWHELWSWIMTHKAFEHAENENAYFQRIQDSQSSQRHSPSLHHGRNPWGDTRNHSGHWGLVHPTKTRTCRECSCWADCATSPWSDQSLTFFTFNSNSVALPSVHIGFVLDSLHSLHSFLSFWTLLACKPRK